MPLVRADRCADLRPDQVRDGTVAVDEPGNPQHLLVELHAAEPSRRRHAARGLADHPPAASDLCARLGVEPAASVRSVILTSLVALRTDTTVLGLLPYLRSEDAGLRNAVIEALQHMPDALGPHIRCLLDDDDSDVRIFAVNVLSALAHKQAARWLEAVLRCDSHVNVCAAAVEGLAELGGPESRPALAELPERFPAEPFIAFAVQAALKRIGDT